MEKTDSREVLVRAASSLLRQRGYAGTGLSEILSEAKLPKGSLYHHFPGGKRELAAVATRWAGGWVEGLVDRAYAGAADFRAGSIVLCTALADSVARHGKVAACPVISVLQATTDEPALRETVQAVYSGWLDCLRGHADRLGEAEPDRAAKALHRQIQGAWVVAFAWQSEMPFRELAEDLAI